MLIKWTSGHSFIVIVGAVMALLTYLAGVPSCAPYAQPALAVLTVLMGYLGITTGKGANGVGGPKAPVAILMLCGVATATSGCSWLQSPQGAQAIVTGIDATVCILNHSDEPIAQIVKDCDGVVAADVERVLSAHTAAMQRAAAAHGGK